MTPFPFAYPGARLIRRHAPNYAADWEQYRPWLRDEFEYRCVYCLRRERWIGRRAQFAIDHIVPRVSGGSPLDYSNLAYACVRCNSAKGDNAVPHPDDIAYGHCVEVDNDGAIRWLSCNREGRMLVRSVRLSEPELTRLRRDEIRYLRNLYRYEPQRFQERMSYPDDLPDLKLKRPTANGRPDSWRTSAHARKYPG
jgi:hypothetical protein